MTRVIWTGASRARNVVDERDAMIRACRRSTIVNFLKAGALFVELPADGIAALAAAAREGRDDTRGAGGAS